ncbi:betaine/carnitine transporter, BCCT family [Desulfocicer vacuolatum DSM 3385]|uniref:Betaine/carnitine transporter, BCCT family n=1 Tax=Desulfocicer vacuolatum DSM 3385 TaxID=1121400 RepID=A0A1W2EXJ9_9BACT|nr:BCCT family transporter [Desulfocicer vacuolatum]SMD14404.1 betaine/carnitine transporter, BCCT family [Desulfocicer vacuolatum DSM 3385]
MKADSPAQDTKVDKTVLIPAMVVIIFVCGLLTAFPEAGGKYLNRLLAFTTNELGILYLWLGVFSLGFMGWIIFGKYGAIKLGKPEETPEFSTPSWIMMLFCAGLGSGALYWGSIEWAYYYLSPPFSLAPKSVEAGNHAAMYGMFHWGIMAWAMYALPSVPIAYAFHVKKIPYLRMSSACKGILGHHADGLPGKIIDIFFILGLMGGVGATLGLSTPMLSQGIAQLTGLVRSFEMDVVIIVLWTALFGTSVYLGLERGIKRLSDFNVCIGLALICFMLFSGPTIFILSTFTNSVGLLFDKFILMSLGTDPIGKSGFAQGWTIFYWAWWIAYAPYMGLFVTRISRGRSLGEMAFAQCFWGSMGCWVIFSVLGNTGLYFELNEIVPVTRILTDQGAPAAIIEIIRHFPLGSGVLVIFLILGFVYSATTMDSAAFVVASVASDKMLPTDQPARWHRLLWALVLGGVTLTMMYLGGLKNIQTLCVVAAFPLIFIIGLSVCSLLRWLKEDEPTTPQN